MDNENTIDALNERLFKKRLIDMTGRELYNLVSAAINDTTKEPGFVSIPPLVYGISGLARLRGCSDTTAWRHRKSGKFDAATSQLGDTLVFDSRKVLEIMRETKNNSE